MAGDGWLEYDAATLNHDATSNQTLLDANSALGLFRRNPMDASTGQPRNRFLDDALVRRALQHWWEPTQPAVLEALGPPCARCDKPHLSAMCPYFPGPRGRSCTDWCNTSSMDQTAADIADALHAVATGGVQRRRIFRISNDMYSDGTGHHWFSIICDMERQQ